jgi:hypothetical protein
MRRSILFFFLAALFLITASGCEKTDLSKEVLHKAKEIKKAFEKENHEAERYLGRKAQKVEEKLGEALRWAGKKLRTEEKRESKDTHKPDQRK